MSCPGSSRGATFADLTPQQLDVLFERSTMQLPIRLNVPRMHGKAYARRVQEIIATRNRLELPDTDT
jgi:hypothetical protein